MITTLALLQVGFNLLMLLGLVRLLRERATLAQAAKVREERLESLAADVCAVGRDLTRQAAPAPADRTVKEEVAPSPGRRVGSEAGDCEARAKRVQGAAALLAQGASVERVVAATALSEGEVQILRNLRRPVQTPPRGRGRRAAPKNGGSRSGGEGRLRAASADAAGATRAARSREAGQ
jgi:hypothetical protein